YILLGIGWVIILILSTRAISRGALSRGIFLLIGAPLTGGLIGATGEAFVFAIYTRYHVEWEKAGDRSENSDRPDTQKLEHHRQSDPQGTPKS
ncbi:MAG TPA: hypothetical protein VHM91_25465, partial [Verrucomicrobiales bacterium]|nr:hypothetical protein [Verrucomicrobiales bacterium]